MYTEMLYNKDTNSLKILHTCVFFINKNGNLLVMGCNEL